MLLLQINWIEKRKINTKEQKAHKKAYAENSNSRKMTYG